MLPTIAITPGEPAGIGPDLAIRTAQTDYACTRIYFADPELLQQRASLLGIDVNIISLNSLQDIPEPATTDMLVYPVSMQTHSVSGELNTLNAHYVLNCIEQAVKSQQDGYTHALMTGPIHKGVINDAGIEFTGHTEFLAQLTQGTPVMMLAAEKEKLRVALATTHLPLSEVSHAITQDSLFQVLNILHTDLIKQYGFTTPRILVCGLNPHAGEGGHMGREEIEVIEPVLEQLRNKGFDLTGPLPADTLFTPKYLQQADAVLAMYHDQGLPVLKHVGFGHAINVTLGLPIIRTSVDHGTALELAGSDSVDTGSYEAALLAAIQLANASQKHRGAS